MKKRDRVIIAAFERSINLNVRIVKSKKEFNRKRLKQETKKDWITSLIQKGEKIWVLHLGFYELLDEEPEDAREISHQYVVSANSEIELLDKDRNVVKTFEVSDLRRVNYSAINMPSLIDQTKLLRNWLTTIDKLPYLQMLLQFVALCRLCKLG